MSQGKQVSHYIVDKTRWKLTGDAYIDITHPGNWPGAAEWGCVVASFLRGSKSMDLPPGDLNYFTSEEECESFLENLNKETRMIDHAAITFVYKWDWGPEFVKIVEVNCD